MFLQQTVPNFFKKIPGNPSYKFVRYFFSNEKEKLKLLTLYDALLMLTNRPLLVSVHFRRSIISRCSRGLQSLDFDPLTTSDGEVFLPFKTSRSSS